MRFIADFVDNRGKVTRVAETDDLVPDRATAAEAEFRQAIDDITATFTGADFPRVDELARQLLGTDLGQLVAWVSYQAGRRQLGDRRQRETDI